MYQILPISLQHINHITSKKKVIFHLFKFGRTQKFGPPSHLSFGLFTHFLDGSLKTKISIQTFHLVICQHIQCWLIVDTTDHCTLAIVTR